MADWLYREAGKLIKPDPALWLKILTPEIWEPQRAFEANIERARAFWRIQPYLVEHATINVSNLLHATWELTGKPFLDREDPNSEALSATIRSRLIQQFEKRYAETGDKDLSAGYDFERALDRFDIFIKSDPDFENEVFGTFVAQMVATWIAFETLAADLWRVILLCDPGAVARTDEFSFQTLRKIRLAYEALMPRSHKIDALLANIGLRKLNLVRNVALHKGGIVDETFLKGAVEISWDVPDEINHPLKLDGARVRDLINPVIQCGIDLIMAVDEWITLERQSRKNP